MTNIAIIGIGYVGLVTGVVLSEIGHTVTCIDIDQKKIQTLQQGKSPIYEPGLDELMLKNIKANRLFFTTSHKEAFNSAEIIFIAVGTPQSESGAADLNYIEQATLDIAHNITTNTIVVVKSTVPIGTNDLIESIIHENLNVKLQVDVVSNPEFLREGYAIHDTFHADRIIIGSDKVEIGNKVEALFKPLNLPIIRTNRRSAEMIKYAANAFLATKISFINEIANLSEKIGVNVLDVAEGIGMDYRIGRAFLNAGIGYGGSCFPKDTKAITYLANEVNAQLSIVESAIKVNKRQSEMFLNKILSYFDYDIQGKKLALLGLAFKPNTDDMREAPSLYLISELEKLGGIVQAYDPIVNTLPECMKSIELACQETDAVIVVTEWKEFIEADWNRLGSFVRNKVLFDGRNCLNDNEAIRKEWDYYGVGLPR